MGYLFTVLALILTALAYRYVISPIVTERYLFSLLSEEPADSPELVPKVFRGFLPRRSVISSLSLPIPGREGEEVAYGTVAVSRAGIFIISRIYGDGRIDNSPHEGKWRFYSHGYVKEVTNPFREQEAPRRLLAAYAAAAGVADVKVHTWIVYTDPMLKFSHPTPKGIMHISESYKRMRRMSAKGGLSRKNIRAIRAVLKDANDGIVPSACTDIVRKR